ncbi:hypothetical protein [Nonomuraea helvata]|uniref:Uncharacterized protein n=2 Tax=Nonomuraea helvata TaxID=37484 RepID=A0ABV5S3P7_9ACTN
MSVPFGELTTSMRTPAVASVKDCAGWWAASSSGAQPDPGVEPGVASRTRRGPFPVGVAESTL